MTARGPETYVHGLEGPCVVVSARVAALLIGPLGLGTWARDHRGEDRELDEVLVALRVATAYWRDRLASDAGSSAAPSAEVAPPSPVMSTAQAAGRVGCTDRAIRAACHDGRLPAELVGGRWVVRREDVEHFRAERAA